ncbi:MAG TPA: hypothetical protein DEP87_03285 [Candidatus Pacebacteria bacterium]|nr:hypothetical protein [Candidatus Paceibacterota bacterium]
MAKKRTKAQKIKTAFERKNLIETQSENRLQPQANLMYEALPSKVQTQNQILPSPTTKLWRFHPNLIHRDLIKTSLVSLLIVGILVLVYWLSFGK